MAYKQFSLGWGIKVREGWSTIEYHLWKWISCMNLEQEVTLGVERTLHTVKAHYVPIQPERLFFAPYSSIYSIALPFYYSIYLVFTVCSVLHMCILT